MTRKCVTDDQYGQLKRRMDELARRVDEGSLSFDRTMRALQYVIEDKFRFGGDTGESQVAPAPYLIDCDADPYIPEGWTVEKKEDQLAGKVCGQVVWDPAQIKLRLSPNQQNGKYINGHKLQKELANEPVLPANILDYLLKNPHLIPEEWKKDADGNTRYIFFWGTIYRDSGGDQYVRCLCFVGGGWCWSCRWLGHDWGGGGPAALRASS